MKMLLLQFKVILQFKFFMHLVLDKLFNLIFLL